VADAIGFDGPAAIRFPKATAGPDIPALTRMDGIDILHRSHRRPLDVLILAAGVTAKPCLHAAQLLNARGIGVTVIDPRWVLPIPPATVHLAARHRAVVTVEDALAAGGIGTHLAAACTQQQIFTAVQSLGLPSAFIDAGDRAQLLADHGLTGDHIAQTALQTLHAHPTPNPNPDAKQTGTGSAGAGAYLTRQRRS
jgi:1-deoxy-D-xylulose-5-phosphate synthase